MARRQYHSMVRQEEVVNWNASTGAQRAADWLGELRASSWLGDLPDDRSHEENGNSRIPPRPPMPRYRRSMKNSIPPEPDFKDFEDEASPPPSWPPPPREIIREGSRQYEKKSDQRTQQPPPLKLPPPSPTTAFRFGPHMTPTPLHASSGSHARRALRPPVDQRPFDLPDAPQVPEPPIEAWHANEGFGYAAASISKGSINNNPINTAATTTINSARHTTHDTNGDGNGFYDEDNLIYCTGQCGKRWSCWQDVPHWSKSRPRKPWCQECGQDKPGPWNEWGSGW